MHQLLKVVLSLHVWLDSLTVNSKEGCHLQMPGADACASVPASPVTPPSAGCSSDACTLLQELSLAGNLLTTLPDAIGNLSSLQRLQMAGNLLTSLPDSICQLTDLEVSCDCLMWYSWGKAKEAWPPNS